MVFHNEALRDNDINDTDTIDKNLHISQLHSRHIFKQTNPLQNEETNKIENIRRVVSCLGQ